MTLKESGEREPLISIIIVTKNRKNKLLQCLSVLNSRFPTIPVCVIEDGSVPNETLCHEELRKNHQYSQLVHIETSKGISQARNEGIRNTKSTFVVFLDDDALINKLPIATIRNIFENNNIGIIAPLIHYPDGSLQESIRTYPTLLAILWRGTKLYTLFPHAPWYARSIAHPGNTSKDIDWAIGACLIIRRTLFSRIGMFDEKFTFGYEDADFCWRAKQAGVTVLYCPHIHVTHEYSRKSARGINMYLIKHLYSIFRFFKKHGFVFLKK